MWLPFFTRLLFAALALVGVARAEQVVFSEVMFNPAGTKPEFIEVWNITATPLDMAQWRFSSGIDFNFPAFTAASSQAHILKGGERILISSASDAATRAAYSGIPAGVRIFGPWSATTSLDNNGERITLKDKNGVIVTTLDYGDSGKWAVAPDGFGHSLVLSDENRAIDDWRVWRASTNNGGSPGVADPAALAAGLALNEVHFRASDGHVDWIELRNNSTTTAQNAATAFLGSAESFAGKITLSGTVAVGALAVFNVDFAPDNNGDITIYLCDASNHIRDAVKLRQKVGRDSWQVFPAGSREWYSATAATQNAANNPARNTDIVINEIMADPPSNQRDGEFVELHNRGAQAVNVGGWRLGDAADFTIPAGTIIAPGGYLVLAANAAWLNASNPGLTALGNWSGSLSNGGDRLRLEDADGNLVNQVDYRFGGEWPELAGGKGSSLELVNPAADNATGSAWRDSDESAKSAFTSFTLPLGIYRDLTQGSVNDDEMRVWLPGDGHVILKNIVLRPTAGGANLFVNGEVSTLLNNNTAGWQSAGTHWAGYHDAEGVHIVADGHGDNKINHAQKDAAGLTVSVDYTMTFDARWVYGTPRLAVQSWDLSIGNTALLPIPLNLGTPGAQNSRFAALPAPTLTSLRHSPAVPNTTATVTVTATVASASPLASVQLWHRLDNAAGNAAWSTTTMNDAGTGGDVLAGDGIYTVQIAPASFASYGTAGSVIEYYVKATATNGAVGYLPRASVVPEPLATSQPRTGLWVVDTQAPATDLRRVRIVMSNKWLGALNTPTPPSTTPTGQGEPATGGGSETYNFKFPRFSNHYFPCVFIHNDGEIYYGASARKTGSPFTRQADNFLTRGRVTLPGDRSFRGKNKIYWDNDAAGSTMLHNRIHRYLLYLTGVPGNENEVCRVTRNNSAYAVRETSEVFDKQMLDRIWTDGSDGQFYEIDDRFWMGDDGHTRLNGLDGSWDYNIANSPGAENPTSYHNNFIPKSRETEYDYAAFIEWCRQIETNTTITPEQMERMVDTQAVAAYAAVRGYTADWDNITMSRGKNGFFYNRSTDRKWMFLHWDSDNTFQPARINDAVIGPIVNVGTYYAKPHVRRYLNYYLSEMLGSFALNGPRLSAWLTAEENATASYSVPTTYATWPTTLATVGTSQTRVAVIQAFIGATSLNAAFALSTPANNSTTTSETLAVTGTAAVGAFSVICVNHPEAVLAWTGTAATNTSPFSLTGIQIANGANVLIFRQLDRDGAQVGSDLTLTVSKTNNAAPVVVVDSDPGSQNVGLGEILSVNAAASYDPDGTPLGFTFTTSPATGFSVSAPTASSRNYQFTTPGSYTLTIQATDGASVSTTATRVFTVFSASQFENFGGNFLPASIFATGVELRDNYSPAAWYSLNETSGSLVLQITADATVPARTGAAIFPRVGRALPGSGDFALETNFILETRQFGAFQSGLYLEGVEGATPVRYLFALDGGTAFTAWRSTSEGAYTQLGTLAYAGGDLTLRVVRSGASLLFQRRLNGAWTTVATQTLPAGATFSTGSIAVATGAVNSAVTTPGQGTRAAFDYLLLADPGAANNLVGNLRITEIMYNPSGAGGVEFIELKNFGAAALNLTGCYFEDGTPFSARFTFPTATLQPGQYCVVTNNFTAFTNLYGNGALVFGPTSGSLNNDGERITLRDADGNPIHDFSYSDLAPWPTSADGGGPSIEALTTDPALYEIGTNWRASQEVGGSPGYLGLATDSDADGTPDAIELAWGSNPTSASSAPQPPVPSLANGGGIQIAWSSQPGRAYTVQYRDNLATGIWLDLATVTATTATTTHSDSTATPNRFYRVKTRLP